MEKIANAYKKCPRCKNKVHDHEKKCSECGLIFSRLAEAKNKYAKKELLHFNRKNVVYVRTLPSDVNRVVLALLCLFLGLFGAHNFYVGRYIRAVYMFVVGIASYIIVALNLSSESYNTFMSFFFVFVGVLAYLWITDLVLIIINKFKVPVALERK